MPLDAQEEGIVRRVDGLDHLVGGVAADLQPGGQIFDGLVMHAVHRDGGVVLAQDAGQQGAGDHVHGVGRNLVGEGLAVGDGEIRLKLAGDILVQGAAHGRVEKLDAAADAEDGLSKFHDQGNQGYLQGVPLLGNISAFCIGLLPVQEGVDVVPAGEEDAVHAGRQVPQLILGHLHGEDDGGGAGAADGPQVGGVDKKPVILRVVAGGDTDKRSFHRHSLLLLNMIVLQYNMIKAPSAGRGFYVMPITISLRLLLSGR